MGAAGTGTAFSRRADGSVIDRAQRRTVLAGLAVAAALATRPVGAAGIARAAAPHGVPAKLPVAPSAWLQRIRDAALNVSYQGTMTYSAGGAVSSSRIAHYCSGRDRFERVEGLDGQVRQQYRLNQQVVTLWPATRLAVIEQQEAMSDFPALPPAVPGTFDHYDLRQVGVERVSGLEADVMLLAPRDQRRFAQRLWADRRSGLMLRADMIGSKGDVLETSAFTDIVLDPKAELETVRGPMKRLEGYKVVRPKVVKTRLEDEGWGLTQPVPGFEGVGCSRRPLDTNGAEPASAVQVLQAVFSDGLAQVSLFVEPYDAQRHKPVRSTLGATHTLMSRRGQWWLTVMGEVPMSTVQLFESALQRRH
jgi:sigma-E factor negative regulatory protein RseB